MTFNRKKNLFYAYLLLIFSVLSAWQCRENNETNKIENKNDPFAKAEIRILTERNEGIVLLKAHANTIVGLNRMAESDEEKKNVENKLQTFHENFSDIISFPPELNCKLKKKELKIIEEEGRPKVHSLYELHCDKLLKGVEISIDLAKFYPAITTLIVVQPSGEKEILYNEENNSRSAKVKIE